MNFLDFFFKNTASSLQKENALKGQVFFKNNDWKYTPQRIFQKITLERSPQEESFSLKEISQWDQQALCFENGILIKIPQKIPQGMSLSCSAPKISCSDQRNFFTKSNLSFFSKMWTIQLEENTIIKKPLRIIHRIKGSKKNTIFFPQSLKVILKKGSSLEIEEYLQSKDANPFFYNYSEFFQLSVAATLKHAYQQTFNHKAYVMYSIDLNLSQKAESYCYSQSSGALYSRNTLHTNMNGIDSKMHSLGTYVLKNRQCCENYTTTNHLQPKCESSQTYKGILQDNALATFSGMIKIENIAKKSIAQQINKNLILSQKARINSEPQLDIKNDDVKASHGATVGQINEDELFYLLTRGFEPESARAILCQAFLKEIFEKTLLKKANKEDWFNKLLTNLNPILK